MSRENTSPDASEGVTVSVEKSSLDDLLSGYSEVGLDGEFIWPISPRSLWTLYRSSAEHSRAINVKAESAFGGGLIGDAEKIETLCETGVADLFVHLGLDLETYGNAFLQVIRSKRDRRIIGLHRLPAITMTRYRAGFLQRVTGADGKEKKRTYTAQEVIHLRDLCPRGFRYALPTWIGVEDMLELAHAATRYNAAFFKNGAMPEYAVIFKGQQATKEAKQEIRDFFRNEHQGVDQAHRTMVLQSSDEGSVEFEKLTADVKDGDFLKLLDASRDRIPVAHGTPPRVLGIMTAGQLGGGGEVAGQLFTFEHLTLPQASTRATKLCATYSRRTPSRCSHS
uniref:phage portal protein n=1 Tax=Thalassobius sp. I31.1 TaxID=2109912 RepID=UPI00130029BD